jgi:peptidoglycan/LPS O-acetylase OafA/YrhL
MASDDLGKFNRRADLDGLRGVAIILTILLHYVSRSGYFPSLGSTPVALLLGSFWSGVDIFFVLSGFLIGGIILDIGKADNFFRVFYLRRALRILPVAFLAIAFSYLIIPLFNLTFLWYSQVPPYAYVFFVNNFWTASGLHGYQPLDPLWSLAIEEQFYLIAPAFILSVGPRVRNVVLLAIVMIRRSCVCASCIFLPGTLHFFGLTGFPRECWSPCCYVAHVSASLPPAAE